MKPTTQTTMEGTEAWFTCVSEIPQDTIWFFNNGPLPPNVGVKYLNKNNLTITGVTKHNAGYYECLGRFEGLYNQWNWFSATGELSVRGNRFACNNYYL